MNRTTTDVTMRSALSLAGPLLGPGPRFDPGEPAVNQEVIERLVGQANPATGGGAAPARPADMSAQEYKELKALAADIFNPDPDIGSAALKKIARLTGNEEALKGLIAPRTEPEPDVDAVDQGGSGAASDPHLDLALDFYTNYLSTGIEKIMATRDMDELRAVAKRTKGDKFDEARWNDEMRDRLGRKVTDGFVRLNASGQKIQAKTLERVLSGAQDDIIGLIRSTIGDPTGIGRHASAQASFPGADIPEERTRLPSIADVRKDPFTARDKISEANQAAFAKKLAALRAGADGTSA
jgi:hypothetical protein